MAILGRAKKSKMYHGRVGRPVIHITKSGSKYVMVRKSGGGVRRLYEGSKYREDGTMKRLVLGGK